MRLSFGCLFISESKFGLYSLLVLKVVIFFMTLPPSHRNYSSYCNSIFFQITFRKHIQIIILRIIKKKIHLCFIKVLIYSKIKKKSYKYNFFMSIIKKNTHIFLINKNDFNN